DGARPEGFAVYTERDGALHPVELPRDQAEQAVLAAVPEVQQHGQRGQGTTQRDDDGQHSELSQHLLTAPAPTPRRAAGCTRGHRGPGDTILPVHSTHERYAERGA